MGVKKEEEEPFSAPGWIVTFSDMIGLLTSFFIMLLTYSTKEQSDYRKLQGALMGEFGLIADPDTADFDAFLRPDEALLNEVRNDGLRRARKDLEKLAEGADMLVRRSDVGETVQFERNAEGLRISITSPTAFTAGSSHLPADARRVLAEVADMLRLHRSKVVVVGHCWDEGSASPTPDERMKLSRERAAAAAAWLTGRGGVAADRVAIGARSDLDPLDPDHGEAAARRNRRIEILVLEDA